MRKLRQIVTIPVMGATAAGLLSLVVALPGLAGPREIGATSAKQAQIAHGEYLVKGIAGCGDCHSPMNQKGEPIPGQWLKGTKLSFSPTVPIPAWADVSPNIAGLNGWSSEQVIHLLMTGIAPNGHRPRPPMPQYRMNHTDAAAVVAYLKSLK